MVDHARFEPATDDIGTSSNYLNNICPKTKLEAEGTKTSRGASGLVEHQAE